MSLRFSHRFRGSAQYQLTLYFLWCQIWYLIGASLVTILSCWHEKMLKVCIINKVISGFSQYCLFWLCASRPCAHVFWFSGSGMKFVLKFVDNFNAFFFFQISQDLDQLNMLTLICKENGKWVKGCLSYCQNICVPFFTHCFPLLSEYFGFSTHLWTF